MSNNNYSIENLKSLLEKIIDGRIDLVLATRELPKFYEHKGENIIPIELGVGYESELDDVPIPSEYEHWNNEALKIKLSKVDIYRDQIISDSKKLLESLNENYKATGANSDLPPFNRQM